jgi:hypothetical protein
VGKVLSTRALYQTVLLFEPAALVVWMVNGEPLAGMAAYVKALGAALEIVAPGPEPKPLRLSTRQPHVLLASVAGEAGLPLPALMLLAPLVMAVETPLASFKVTV